MTVSELQNMGCISATLHYVLDGESAAQLDFAAVVDLGGYGAEVELQGKRWRVFSAGWSSENEKLRRYSVTLKDEDAWQNMTPYLGRPDWKDVFPQYITGSNRPIFARVSQIMSAIGQPWDEEDARIPVPSLSGGESLGDIKAQVLHWVQRNLPPAGDAPQGALLRYEAGSTAHSVGWVDLGTHTLPVGGLRTGIFIGGAEVRAAQPVNAAGLASAINAANMGVTASASGTRVTLTATTAGEAGSDISLFVSEEEGEVTTSGRALTGWADEEISSEGARAAIYLSVGTVADWSDMGMPTSIWLEAAVPSLGAWVSFDYDTMGQVSTATEYADAFTAYCAEKGYPFTASRIDDLTVRIEYNEVGEEGNNVPFLLTNIRHPSQRFGLGQSADNIVYSEENRMYMAGGVDAVIIPAKPASGWIDLGNTGSHPKVEHTGLFVNGTEVLGHGITASALATLLRKSGSPYGVTATASGTRVNLVARATGAAGNGIGLEYRGNAGVTLSGPFLSGGTLGAVRQVARLWGGEDSRAISLSVTPRYDLVCPAAGVYGRYNIVFPQGAPLSQPGAFAYYVPTLDLATAGGGQTTANGYPSAWDSDIQDAAGQWMVVRGLKVPQGWSASKEGGTTNPAQTLDFWTKFAQFRILKDLGSYVMWGKMRFYPLSEAEAYPPITNGMASDAEIAPPANYKPMVDGNLFVLTQGSFPASSRARNNPSGLHFCRGSLRQEVYLQSWPKAYPEGVTREDLEKIFTDTFFPDANANSPRRAVTLVLDSVFIDRAYKRFKTGTNADYTGGDGEEGSGGNGGTSEEEATMQDYRYAMEQFYRTHSVLYHDVQVDMAGVPDIDPESLLGCQLVAEEGQTAACPVREVTVDLLGNRLSVTAGSPELLSFDELLQQRMLAKKAQLGSISRVTGGIYE